MVRPILLAILVLIAPRGAVAQPATEPLPADRLGPALAALPARSGPEPATTPGIPHVQLDQNAPVAMRTALLEAVQTLDDVTLWETPYSLPGSVGWLLPASARQGPEGAYTAEGEFGHAHRPQDGSMHLRLTAAAARTVLEKGWGILHPFSAEIAGGSQVSYLMVYGPRDEVDLEAVWVIVQASYATARGLDLQHTSTTAIEPATWGQTKESGSD